MTQGVADGITQGTQAMLEAWDYPLQTMANSLPQSEPEVGPLAGKFLWTAGEKMMDMISVGVETGQWDFESRLSTVLSDSFVNAFAVYEQTVTDTMKNSKVMEDINTKIISGLGANKSIMSADFNVNKEMKAEMSALMNIPGIAGVTAAIVMEGVKTRKVLSNIEKNTYGTWYNTLGGTKGNAKATAPVLPV